MAQRDRTALKKEKKERDIFSLRETWAILISVTFRDLKYFIRVYFLGM